jgi:beta-N-acetylhexosaminidase
MIPLERLSVAQKLGRVLCMRVMENADNLDFTLEMIKKQAVGCVQVTVNEGAKEVIARLRAAADYPLLIVNDMERGYAPSGLPSVPLLSLAATDDTEYARVFAAGVAKHAKEDGFNGCWGPVLDILYNDGPCRVARTAADTPEGVLRLAREINRVFRSYGFLGTGKHYPGGADKNMDTHMVEGISYDTEEALLQGSLVPYLELMKEGLLPAVMVGHTLFPNIDPDYPASLSKKVIDIIRRAGYDGLIYTDSLAMMGILQKYGEENAMALALMAGNDIILPNYRTPMRRAYEMMLDAYDKGQITDEALDAAVRRVMAAEALDAVPVGEPYPLPDNAAEILARIARDSITALCDKGISPSIDTEKRRLFVVMTAQGYRDDVGVAEISEREWYSPARVKNAIEARFPQAEIVTMPEFPDARQNEAVLTAATRHSEVVFVTYCNTAPYLGTDGLTRRAESVINALALSGKLTAIVHFGNPLALSPLLPIPRRIFGYGAPEAQQYAFDVLSGALPARGRMPFPNLI